MTKAVLSSSLFLALLCGPALADSNVTYVVDLVTKAGRQTVYLADHACGEIQLKTPQKESFFRVCANASDTKSVRLDLERRTRENTEEARTTAVVMATPGLTIDLLDAKLTVKTQ